MSAVDLQNEPVRGEHSSSNSGFTNRMPNSSNLPSPESVSVDEDDIQSSSSSEDRTNRGRSTYRRSARTDEYRYIPPPVIPPPAGTVPPLPFPDISWNGNGNGPPRRMDWATTYYGGLGGPVPRNAYPGYPLAFDNVKMEGDKMDRLAELLKEHDKKKVENSNGDIDALLILTGLFSAIVAAFTIESYKNLQPDPALASATLLAQLVLHFNGTTGLQNTGFTFSPLPDSAASMDVLVNSFWFLSLICSVITASVGIFIKQWLRDYLNIACSSSEEWVRVRQVRHESIHRWKVFEVSAFLPLLLQLALLLFLIGLALFLLSINLVVGWIVTAGVILYVSGLLFIVVVPMVSSSCPYQIAFLRRAAEYIRGSLIRLIYGSRWRQRLGYENPFYRFPGDERGVRREQRLDVKAVIGADTSLMDNTALEVTLQPCLSSFGLKSTLLFVREVLANRLDRPVTHLKEIKPDDYSSLPRQVLDVLLNVFCDCTENILGNDMIPLAIPNMERFQIIVEAMWGLSTLLDHLYKTDRRRHMSSWNRAAMRMNSGIVPGLCLDPSVLDTVPEDVRLQIVNYGSEEFVRMMVECPNARIEDNAPLSANAVKNLLQAATKCLRFRAFGRVTIVSLTRRIFQALAYNDISGDIPSFAPELRIFCNTIVAQSQWFPRHNSHAPSDDDELDDFAKEASSAANAADALNLKMSRTSESGPINPELISTLRAL